MCASRGAPTSVTRCCFAITSAQPAIRDAYAQLKRQLAQHLADPSVYPEVKDPAVDLVYLAAEAWAAASGWQAGPPDA